MKFRIKHFQKGIIAAASEHLLHKDQSRNIKGHSMKDLHFGFILEYFRKLTPFCATYLCIKVKLKLIV